ncbi:1058_t:CDS:2 [Acaulospora morrowiae]|uniref:1058_t:CDS:1 n=1 Tax=Acaulospora morrowiae TaxID=94023 RepID=A0A9N8VU44_9GLOM|nr:1058_t:CDS:2 [Acaulospora morrowiae]
MAVISATETVTLRDHYTDDYMMVKLMFIAPINRSPSSMPPSFHESSSHITSRQSFPAHYFPVTIWNTTLSMSPVQSYRAIQEDKGIACNQREDLFGQVRSTDSTIEKFTENRMHFKRNADRSTMKGKDHGGKRLDEDVASSILGTTTFRIRSIRSYCLMIKEFGKFQKIIFFAENKMSDRCSPS